MITGRTNERNVRSKGIYTKRIMDRKYEREERT